MEKPMNMIERCAKAIYAKRNGAGCKPWSLQTKAHKGPYLDDARAAIEEMREDDLKELLTDRKFDSKAIADSSGCLLWTGPIDRKDGYGRFYDGSGKTTGAHQYAFRRAYGPVPEGKVVDHICRTRNCVNHSHLRAISAVENTMIGEGIAAMNAAKTYCAHGHPLFGENLYVRPNGERDCRKCRSAANLRYKRKKRLIDASTKESANA
jgi:hypothetical protein